MSIQKQSALTGGNPIQASNSSNTSQIVAQAPNAAVAAGRLLAAFHHVPAKYPRHGAASMTRRRVEGVHQRHEGPLQSTPCPALGPDLTGPSMSMSMFMSTSTTRPALKSQDAVSTCPQSSPDGGYFEPAPWRQPNGTRQQRRWRRPLQPCPAGIHSRAARPFSPGEARQSVDGFPRPLPKVDDGTGWGNPTRCF